jgi:hypothetical protein
VIRSFTECTACPTGDWLHRRGECDPQHKNTLPCPEVCVPCPACDNTSKSFSDKACYTKAEQRHGLNLWCGSDITVKGLRVDLSGGDGIMTGGLESGDEGGPGRSRTRDVFIKDVDLSNSTYAGSSVLTSTS